MKCLFWNIRGLANSPLKLVLKNILKDHKPDFYFITEPWMNHAKLRASFLDRLGLKLFAINHKANLMPNIWFICKRDLDSHIVSVTDQLVSFTVSLENLTLGFISVYTSTCHLVRWRLRNDLSNTMAANNLLWCLVGDYNSILGAHEHMGSRSPNRILIVDLQN